MESTASAGSTKLSQFSLTLICGMGEQPQTSSLPVSVHVGVNALVLKNTLTGVAKRVLSLYSRIVKINPRVVVYFFSPYSLPPSVLSDLRGYGIDFSSPSFKLIVTPIWGKFNKIPGVKEVAEWWWVHFRLPLLLHCYQIKLYEAPWGSGIPVLFPYRVIRWLSWIWGGSDFLKPIMLLTIHDLIPLYGSHMLISKEAKSVGIRKAIVELWDQFFYRRRIHSNIKNADHIITVSQQVKNDIIKYFSDCDNKKITIIPNGINGVSGVQKIYGVYSQSSPLINPFVQQGTRQSNRAYQSAFSTAPPTDFLLYVGGFNPRKNLHRLLVALATIETHKFSNMALILVGKQNRYFYSKLLPVIESHSFPMAWLGYVSETDLLWFYQEATLVCYPSLVEGFGMPPLEALAQGGRVMIDQSLPINYGMDGGDSFVKICLQNTFPTHSQKIEEWWEASVWDVDARDEQEIKNTITEVATTIPSRTQPQIQQFPEIVRLWQDEKSPFNWEKIGKDYYRILVKNM